MNHKTLLIVVLSLVLLAGAVAVGIHVLHQDAHAEEQAYWVWIAWDNDGEWEFPPNLIVEVKTTETGDWIQATYRPDLHMYKAWCVAQDEWQVRFNVTSGFVPVSPGVNPCNGHDGWTILHWIIE